MLPGRIVARSSRKADEFLLPVVLEEELPVESLTRSLRCINVLKVMKERLILQFSKAAGAVQGTRISKLTTPYSSVQTLFSPYVPRQLNTKEGTVFYDQSPNCVPT